MHRPKKIHVTIAFPVDLKRRFERAALRDDRTLTSALCAAMRLWLSKMTRRA